jgi:hypothetical protein
LIGPFGWFHRYEVYIVFFSVLVVLYVLHERPRGLLGWYVLGLFMCAAPYIDALKHTVDSSQDDSAVLMWLVLPAQKVRDRPDK